MIPGAGGWPRQGAQSGRPPGSVGGGALEPSRGGGFCYCNSFCYCYCYCYCYGCVRSQHGSLCHLRLNRKHTKNKAPTLYLDIWGARSRAFRWPPV